MLPTVLPSPRALAALAVCAAALAAAPAAGAATLKLPVPAAGEVAVVAAPVTGKATLKVAKGGVPKGVAVTGGVAGKVALLAVIRPRGAAKPAATAGGGPARGTTATAVLATAAPAALTAAAAPACAGAAAALGHPLRRGPGAPAAADLKTLGKVLAARLCGRDVDAKGAALLGLLRLNAASAKPAAIVPPVPGVVAGASTAPAPPAAPAPGRPTTPAPAPPAATNQCSNGQDDDGDGQVDALGRGAPLFDPGCKDAADPTESSEKATPRACGLGLYTRATRRGFGADFDSLSYDNCPKPMVKGVVDLAAAITDCESPGWDGDAGSASCDKVDGALTIGAGQGGQWQVDGTTAADLCGTRGVVVGYTADGQAWEQELAVFDGAAVCAGPPPGIHACDNGLDDDGDGQVDFAGLAGAGPDPGCASATDAGEDGEVAFDATGCWPIVAADQADPTIAWLYLLPVGAGSACPAMNGAWFTFDAVQATACVDGPYFSQAPAGTCQVKGGDVVVSGATGTTIAVAVKLDHPVGCDRYTPGHTDMRTTDGVIHDGVFDTAYFDAGNVLRLCS